MASGWHQGATGLYLHAVADESRYLLSTMEVRNSAGVTIQVKKYVTACQVKIFLRAHMGLQMRSRNVLVILFLALLVTIVNAACPESVNGAKLWSTASTWPGLAVPGGTFI